MCFVNFHRWFADQNGLCPHPRVLRKGYRCGMKLRSHQTAENPFGLKSWGSPVACLGRSLETNSNSNKHLEVLLFLSQQTQLALASPCLLGCAKLAEGERRPIPLAPALLIHRGRRRRPAPPGQPGLGSGPGDTAMSWGRWCYLPCEAGSL